MSLSYWTIEGVGIPTQKLEAYINKKKFAELVVKMFPDDECTKRILDSGKWDTLNIDDYMYGYPFDNLADAFTYCDDTDTITYGDDGEGNYYFYYPPSLPWHRCENEPGTYDELVKRMVAAVQKLADLSRAEIEEMIDDDLYVIGYD